MNTLNTLVSDVLAEQTGIVEGTVTSEDRAQGSQGTLPSQQVALPAEKPAEQTGEKKFTTRELTYANDPRYKHLRHLLIPGSLMQDTTRVGHPKFANKVRMLIRCGCQFEGEEMQRQEIVERATSDFKTFMGCPAHTKIVKKLRKAAKDLAELRG